MHKLAGTIIVVILLLLSADSYASDGPRIKFHSRSHDFGTVDEAVMVRHDFEFVNEGSGDLRIEDLVPS